MAAGWRGADADLNSTEQVCIVLEVAAGWSSSVARRAHNPEVAGSNPVPATTPEEPGPSQDRAPLLLSVRPSDRREAAALRGRTL